MKITKKDLKTGKAPILYKNGYVNAVLVVRKDSLYDNTNTYLGKWDCCNVKWYNKHIEDYEGYIDLEFLIPKVNKK